MKSLICKEAETSGLICWGEGTIVHPNAKISAVEGGEIIFGSDCIIEEGACIIQAYFCFNEVVKVV
jgi:hypothetical protein